MLSAAAGIREACGSGDVFGRKNEAVWPAQLLFVAVAVAAAGLALRSAARSGSVVSGILAFFWAWMSMVYH